MVSMNVEIVSTSTYWATNRVVAGAQHAAITSDSYASHAHVVLGNQLVRALVLTQVPDANISSTVTADQLALIWMDNHIIDRNAVCVISLYVPAPGVPDLDGPILARRDEPLGLAVECDARDIRRMSVKDEDSIWVGGFDIVELDRVVAGGGEVAFVGRYGQTIDLRIRVWNGTGADTRKRLPEAMVPCQHRMQATMAALCADRIVWSYPAVVVVSINIRVGSQLCAPVHRMTDML